MPPDVLGVLGTFAIAASVPIVAILTAHQRKMAEIIHGNGGQDPDAVVRLSNEVAELRQLVTQQAIALDDLSTMNRRLLQMLPDETSIRQRLNG